MPRQCPSKYTFYYIFNTYKYNDVYYFNTNIIKYILISIILKFEMSIITHCTLSS